MPDLPLISAIIPTYNAGRYVVQAVESALAQSYRPLEVVVVDDGSSDGTTAALAPLRARIRYLRQENKGLSGARNRGIAESHGELIAFLDADDQWSPEKLRLQWQCLQAHPDAHLVHTDLDRLRDSEGTVVHVPRDRKRFSGHCYTELFWSNHVVPSTVLVTRRCLLEVGLFDTGIRRPSTEDWDLWIRIARRFPFCYVDRPLVLYREHGTNASLDRRTMSESELYILTKMLRADPQLWERLGPARARRRIAKLAFEVGYQNVEADDLHRARGYFGTSLRHAPLRARTWMFWASTWLSTGSRARLRTLRRRLVTNRATA
jgi:glycosyltransferase involved in cell wall biosynthesis